MRKQKTTAAAALLLALCSCATDRWVQTNLYFGLSKPDGGFVSDSAWTDFVETEASAVFASGFTVYKAEGKWRDDQTHRLAGEPSMVLAALHPKSRELSAQIDSLRERYKRRFGQASVLRVEADVNAGF